MLKGLNRNHDYATDAQAIAAYYAAKPDDPLFAGIKKRLTGELAGLFKGADPVTVYRDLRGQEKQRGKK